MFSVCHVRVTSLVFDLLCAKLGVRFPYEFILGLHDGVKYADYIPVYIIAKVAKSEFTRARVYHHYADRKIPYCLFLRAMLKYLEGEYYAAGVLLGLAIHILQDIVSRYEIFMMSDIKRLKRIHKSVEHELYKIAKERLSPDFVDACIEGKLSTDSVLEEKLCIVIKETYNMLLKFIKFEIPTEKYIHECRANFDKFELHDALRNLKKGLLKAILSLALLVLLTLQFRELAVLPGLVLVPVIVYGIVQSVSSILRKRKILKKGIQDRVVIVGASMTKYDIVLSQVIEKCDDVIVSEDVVKSSDVIKQLAREARRRRKKKKVA